MPDSPVATAILSELELRELYEQITIRENEGCSEIKHPLCGHLTVYRPRRDDLASHRSDGSPVIMPGYINASSWQTAGLSPKTAKEVYGAMMVYLRILDIATDKLNRYNAVLADWPEFSSPFDDADRLKQARHVIENLNEEIEGLKKKGKKRKAGS